MMFHHSAIKLWAALLMGCFFLTGCENSEQQIRELTSTRIGVEQGKDVAIFHSREGKTKARLTAPVMLRYNDTVAYLEFPKGIHGDFYSDNLAIETRIDAGYARYMESESKVLLRDSVKLINIRGDTLYCSELWWDRMRKGQEFYTDKPISIRRKEEQIDGEGLDAPQDFSEWHIVKVTGIIRIPSSQFPQ